MYKTIILTLLCISVYAEDIDKLAIAQGIGDFKWGTSIDEIKKKKGNPIGVIKINNSTMLVMYSADKAMRFVDKKLVGAIYGSILDYKIAGEMGSSGIGADMPICKGIRLGMTYDEMHALLGESLNATPEYSREVEGDIIKVSLRFSSRVANGKSSFILMSLEVKANKVTVGGEVDVGKETGLF